MTRKLVDGPHAEISNRLRAVRAHFDLSSQDFARRAGVDEKLYSKWESGGNRVSVPGALRIKAAYGISLDFIFDGDRAHLPHAVALSVERYLTGDDPKESG